MVKDLQSVGDEVMSLWNNNPTTKSLSACARRGRNKPGIDQAKII
jgi:hypothetical protein